MIPHPGSIPVSRRALLSASTSLVGAGLLRSAVMASPDAGPSFGRAKRCILLFMWGGPSQLDTFDLKPNAASEVRGEFVPISTAAPDIQISEHFRQLAQLTDRVAIVRSLSHDDPAHLSSAHSTLTGHLPPVNKSDAEPPSPDDSPFLGSVVSRFREPRGSLPGSVLMPWKAYHPAAPGGVAPGQDAGWTGRAHDPMLVTGDPNQPGWKLPALQLADGISLERLQHRQSLLRAIDQQRKTLGRSAVAEGYAQQQQTAVRLLTSPEVHAAFDLSAEPDAVRERYGRNLHGQCVLLGRRLLEQGVPFVTVNWHNDGRNFWDTHGDNFNRLKNDLIPPADRALSALLTDLTDRGMLDDTLVVWVGEFGRRPQITARNAGREHHPFCYSGLLAGGGIRGGTVYGESDAIAQYVERDPVTPHDLAATMLHALGVPEDAAFTDAVNRPRPLYAGRPVLPLFG